MGYLKRWFTLAHLAVVWINALAEEGLSTLRSGTGHPAKETRVKNPRVVLREAEAVPIRLDKNQLLWIQPGGAIREEYGYQSVRVFDAPARNDMAIIAALTVLEAHPIEPSIRVSKAIPFIEKMFEALGVEKLSPLKNWADMDENEEVSLEEFGSTGTQTMEEFLESLLPLLEETKFRGASIDDLQPEVVQTLAYVKDLLRHYRPDFDKLPREDQIALVQHTCVRINTVLEAVRKLVAFAEYGSPSGDSKPAVEQAARDVKAAELHEVMGLSYPKVAEILGEPPPSTRELEHNDHSAVRRMANRGRDILVRAFTEKGWQELIDELQQQHRDWDSLDEKQRCLKLLSVHYSERLGLSLERARKLAEQYTKIEAKRNNTTTAEACRTIAVRYRVLRDARL